MGVKYQVEQLQWNLDGSLDCFLCVCVRSREHLTGHCTETLLKIQ